MVVPPTIGVATASSGDVKIACGRAMDHGMAKSDPCLRFGVLCLSKGDRDYFMDGAKRMHGHSIAIWEFRASLRHWLRPGAAIGYYTSLRGAGLVSAQLVVNRHLSRCSTSFFCTMCALASLSKDRPDRILHFRGHFLEDSLFERDTN